MPNLQSTPSRPSTPTPFSPKRLLTRALMASALLGGAGAALSAGSAQASWTQNGNGYSCNFLSENALGADPGCRVGETTPTTVPIDPTNPGNTFNPHDKKLTIVDWLSIPTTSTLNFTYNPTDPTPWEVDLEFDGQQPGAKDFDGGSLSYLLEITDPDWRFDIAELRWNTGAPSPTVTKQIYSDSSFSAASLICTLNADPSQCNISGTKIWVKDTWGATEGGMDNVSNDYSQTTTVPGPLPVLGAGVAFGFSRKLRRRIQGGRVKA